MRFLGRWLSHSVRLGLALFFALVAMQAPAFTADYTASLLQVSGDARRDIDQREAAARQYYDLPAGDDAALIAGLRAHEPANAATLALSVDRAETLRSARERILAAPALLQPLVAIVDATRDPAGYKAAIWKTQLRTYVVHLDLTLAAIGYGLAGLVLGSLLGHLLCLPFERDARRFANV
ncbi:MAG TPA: DUF2937 family protein [Stellaceae bacterium]|jgi:hypothetical protein